MRSFFSAAYTLIELLVALALSLLLLLAVTQLFSRVGGTMNDTRAAMSVSADIHATAVLLRQDLSQVDDKLAEKPKKIDEKKETGDDDGYLEITEGPEGVDSHSFVDESGNPDKTVGDVDDIIAFTALASRFRGLHPTDMLFRGLIVDDDGEFRVEERNAAEIIWFVRGNSLYRRVRLIDDQRADDPSVNTLIDLARRERRFGHDTLASTNFPYPRGWVHLRMPTLEETLHGDWEPANIPKDFGQSVQPDLWEQPYFFPDLQDRKSGSLNQFVQSPRHPRAGEDIVLTNVLSFDVKVWCPIKQDYVDLGTPGTTWSNSKQPLLPRTWDSWTQQEEGGYKGESPPYTAPLEAIQITIRCFDPASRAIKQVTVVHRFKLPPK